MIVLVEDLQNYLNSEISVTAMCSQGRSLLYLKEMNAVVPIFFFALTLVIHIHDFEEIYSLYFRVAMM